MNLSNDTAVLILGCAASINQDLYRLIDLLNEQTRILKCRLGKRPRFRSEERCALAWLAQEIERRILEAQELIVTVDTFRRWHRQLIARTYTAKRRGRPRLAKTTEELIVRMALDNPHWGEDSIRDRMKDLGFEVSDRTVSAVLRRNGIPPAPERRVTNDWERFLTAHWPCLMAIDFATYEIPSGRRTVRHHALYAIRLQTREAYLISITDQADEAWMLNMARRMADFDTGVLRGMKYVIMDRDPLFTRKVRTCIRSIGCKAKVLPARAPDLNAYIERFIGTVRTEIDSQIIPCRPSTSNTSCPSTSPITTGSAIIRRYLGIVCRFQRATALRNARDRSSAAPGLGNR